MQDFLNPYDVIEMHGATLPHWQQGSAFVFVTWRLADSLPSQKLQTWKEERTIWLSKHPLPWDAEMWQRYNERFPERMETWLDRGLGSCLLRDSGVRQIVCQALDYFDSERYAMEAYVVMPNHVHLLFQPRGDCCIEKILHSWKSYTSKEIHKLSGGAGEFWQKGYWDRLMRSREHLARCVHYIRENPVKAGLAEGDYSLYERRAGVREAK